jgi:hypothetical protein
MLRLWTSERGRERVCVCVGEESRTVMWDEPRFVRHRRAYAPQVMLLLL